jgi:hypothetical protein
VFVLFGGTLTKNERLANVGVGRMDVSELGKKRCLF